MKSEGILKDLEQVAAKNAVRVTYEALKENVGRGGLCRVHGEYRVIVDKRASTRERIVALVGALSQIQVDTTSIARKIRSSVGTISP